jgi:hypothetical protein
MDVLAEGSCAQQVGVEDQRITIGVFAVMKIPAFDIFREDGVKAEPRAHEMAGFGFGEVDHTDGWMQRFVVVEIVVLADRVESS